MAARPRLLDAFSGAGGAARGYQLAGFHVTGVDIKAQPRYAGDAFIQADALDVLADREFLAGFAAVHASPTCQHQANVTDWRGRRDAHPDTLTPTLRLLRDRPVPFIVENVPEALPRWDVVLCGSQFGLNVKRHRGFLAPWLPFGLMPPCQHHRRLLPFMHKGERAYADALGCGWMTNREARQAIPPAFTEWLGGQLLDHIRATQDATWTPSAPVGEAGAEGHTTRTGGAA